MPEFVIPQFIEHKPKIVGPLTFKQFIFFTVAGAICFFLYFTAPFYLFILGSLILMSGAGALAFLKIEGRDLPTLLENFFSFLFSSKIYLWRKESLPPKFVKETEEEKEEIPALAVGGKSQLKNLSIRIETGLK